MNKHHIADMTADPVLLEVFWSRLGSIVTEQAVNIIRTSFSPLVREAGDIATALFDRRGRMLAHGLTGTPGHLIPMTRTILEFLAEYPTETLKEGDVFITNDPWKTTGHFFDITVASPIFDHGRLIGFAASTAHHADIGGTGFGASANDVFEEGLFIPVCKSQEAGVRNETLFKLIRANVREPDAVVGDLDAQNAANEAAGKAMRDLVHEYGISDLDAVVEEIFARSRTAARAALREVPNGDYTSVLHLDGYNEPIKVVLTLKVRDEEIEADFTGTSAQVRKGINVCENYTFGYVAFALRCAIGREIPHNFGSLSTFKIKAEPGSIVSCTFPSPVAARHLVGQMIPGLVLQTFAQAAPRKIMADGAGSVWGVTLNGQNKDDRPYAAVALIAGGIGARAGKDGLSTMQYPTGTRCVPIEVLELEAPFVYHGKELLTDSGGAGKYRGGLGQRVALEILPDGKSCVVNLVCDKTKVGPQGLFDGKAGRIGSTFGAGGAPIHPKQRIIVEDKQFLVLETPGGGGYGNPLERDRSAVKRDLDLGYISEDAARKIYGFHPA